MVTITAVKTRKAEVSYAKGRIYVTLKGSPDGLDRKAQIAVAREAALVAMEHGGAKLVFSQTAGCRCGCSPGFISPLPSLRGLDTWVDAIYVAPAVPVNIVLSEN